MIGTLNGAPLRFPEYGHPEHAPNVPWRGQKADIWEGGHRVPLIVRWPGRLTSGETTSATICLTDPLPTVTAAVGHGLNATPIDGVSALPMLEGGPGATVR